MGWEEQLLDLFEELESRAEVAFAADRVPEIADRSRAEYRAVTLASRFMASVGEEVTVQLAGPGPLTGRVERVGGDWVLLRAAGQDWALLLAAVRAVSGLSPRSVPEVAWPRVAALGLGSALRRLAEDEQPCVLHLRDGGRREGTLLRVGADFVELVEGPGDGGPSRRCVVPLAGLAAAQSRD